MLSVIIPVFNERDNVRPLYDRILVTMEKLGRPFEILWVNDGSIDGTEEILNDIVAGDSRVRIINFTRNQGQTAALMAGFDHVLGDVVIPMDGDQQNDPADIPALLAKLEEGFAVVSGWRHNRKDNAITRRLPSRIANWLISRISGVYLHDYGCTLKAYRKEAISRIRLYGERHRFVPIYAAWHGAKVTEIPVRHHPRNSGTSKYGLGRTYRVILDLMVIKFLDHQQTKPIYVFGGFALLCILFSFLTGLFTVYLRVFDGIYFIQTPLPLLVALTFLVGVLCLLIGLLAEIMVRVYYESQGKPPYIIKSMINVKTPD